MERLLMVCDWDVTYLYSKLAEKINKNNDFKLFAWVNGREYDKFIKTNYPNIFSDCVTIQDHIYSIPKYIENLENRYNAIESRYGNVESCWRFIHADRSYCNEKRLDSLKRIVHTFEFIENLLGNWKISSILAPGFGSLHLLCLHDVANRKGIKIARPVSLRVIQKWYLSNNAYESDEWIRREMKQEKNISPETKKIFDKLKGFNSKPFYMNYNLKKDNLKDILNKGNRLIKYISKYYFTSLYKNDHTKISPHKRLSIIIKKNLNRFLILKWFKDKTIGIENIGDCVYFPLQYQPEMTTMVYGFRYKDQVSLLKDISLSLPLTTKILVKEHPLMIGIRSKSFYKTILSLSNVEIVKPNVSSDKLIERSKAVFTISGTAGLEALIKGKPVFTFGESFYIQSGLTIRLDKFNKFDWYNLIKTNIYSNRKINDNDILKFLQVMIERSFEGLFIEPGADPEKILNERNVDNLATMLIRFLDEEINE